MSLTLGVNVKYTRRIKELTPQRVEKMLNASMVSGGLDIANAWKQYLETHKIWKTGSYARSIHVGGHPDLTPDFEGDVMPQPADLKIVVVGTAIKDPPYPEYLEYGPSRMQPHPSAGPAFDATKDAALKEVGDAFEELLEKDAL